MCLTSFCWMAVACLMPRHWAELGKCSHTHAHLTGHCHCHCLRPDCSGCSRWRTGDQPRSGLSDVRQQTQCRPGLGRQAEGADHLHRGQQAHCQPFQWGNLPERDGTNALITPLVSVPLEAGRSMPVLRCEQHRLLMAELVADAQGPQRTQWRFRSTRIAGRQRPGRTARVGHSPNSAAPLPRSVRPPAR